MNGKQRSVRVMTGLLTLVLLVTLVPLAPLSAQGTPAVSISEIRIDQPSTDYDEYFELAAAPGTALDGLTYLVIGDGAGSGTIEAVVDLTGQAVPASGYFVAAESTFTLGVADLTTSLNFENDDNVTHLLVDGFSGANGDDLDTDDDGVLDVTPWTDLVDLIALVKEENPPSGTEYHYGPPTVGPDGSDVPGHVFRCSDGWYIGAFDPAAGDDTPGAANDCPLQLTSIYEIQYTTDASGDSPYNGQTVTTQGIVTAVFYGGDRVWIQDGVGAWNGLYLYLPDTAPSVGDQVEVTGTIEEYYGLTELADGLITILSSGNPLPEPSVVSTLDLNQEMWESVFVRVEGVTVTNPDLGNGEWQVDDDTGPAVVDDMGEYTYAPALDDELAYVQGPLNYSYGAFKIEPRDDGDIGLQLGYTPIHDIQYTADASGDSPYNGQIVTTQGVVTAVFYGGDRVWIQDGVGAWNGLYLYLPDVAPSVGDRIEVTGTIEEYYGLTELADGLITILSSGNPLPEPSVVSTLGLNQEMWESVLVRVEGVTVTNPDLGNGEWQVDDDTGPAVVDDMGEYTYAPALDDELAYVQGPLNYSYGAFKIEPRDDGDIVQAGSVPVLVINEIMQDPAAVYDNLGEWFELYNPTGGDIDIDGWTIRDDGSDSHVIANGGPLVIPAGGFLVLGNNSDSATNGGVTVDYEYPSNWYLANGADEVVLLDGALTEIDRVEYDGGPTFPDPTGASMALSDPALDNNVGANWCTSSTPFGAGDLGTPGAANVCAAPEACGDPFTAIYAVQGDGYESPIVGEVHSVEGIVTGDFQGSDELDGFFLQDLIADGDPATSDGVFVYAPGGTDVVVGEHVRVRGTVSEYNELTEIGYVENLLSCGTGSIAVTPIDLPVPVDLEPYEGMFVAFPEDLTASQNYFQGRYGQVTLSAEGRLYQPTNQFLPLSPEAIALAEENMRRMIVLDDGMDVSEWGDNPDPIPYIGAGDTLRAGDTVAGLTGVIGYGQITAPPDPNYHYRLHPTGPVEFTRVNERTAAPQDVGGVIKIASFNVLNYFNGDGQGGGFPTSRGADTLYEFERQRTKIISAIVAMDADVVGLMEIENDGYDQYSAIQDLVNGLNDALGAGTYALIDPGVAPVGTDEIAVGFVYKPATVTPVGAAAILDSSVDPLFNSDRNRPAIAQTFERSTGGGRFTAVVNHLKSKGSPCDDIGDPDIGDGQGNCNLTRTNAATALANWLLTDPTFSGDPDFFIIGDLNAYAMEDPITAIKDAGYTNLVDVFGGATAYSYTFDGLAGYLDHSLASPSAVPQVSGTTVWHINTDEPSVIDYNTEFKPQDLYSPTPYRASDHDPVIAGFCDAVPPVVDVTVTPDTLWPPNGRYKVVKASVEVVDAVDPNPELVLVSVTSNEADDSGKPNDIVIMNDFRFRLRAERLGGGDGRIYTITYEATDACGNSTLATATVTVPHDMGEN